MTQLLNKLSYLVSGQLPDYIRDEYPLFTTFIEAYYRFMEEEGEANAVLLNSATWSDIDQTLDDFIPEFRKQFAWDIPYDTIVEFKRFVKYIDQYYEAKGSENATKLFFQFMFNDVATVAYPGDYILRASDGDWTQRRILKLDATHFIDESDPTGIRAFDLQGRIITISYTEYESGVGNVSHTTTTEVQSVVETVFDPILGVGRHIYKLVVNLDPNYPFPLEAIATDPMDTSEDAFNSHIYVTMDGDTYGTLTKQLVSVKSVDDGGSNFRIGDAFIINESGITGAYFQEDYMEYLTGPNAYVAQGLGINNAIVRVRDILSEPDQNYFAEDYIIYDVNNNYVVIPSNHLLVRLGIVTSGHQFNARKDIGPYGDMSYITGDYWQSQTIIPETEFVAIIYPYGDGSPATVTFNTGYLFLEGGRFETNSGLLSDINKLQDNYFYQPFSYVIKSQQQLSVWEDSFKKSAHPAGFKVFSDLQLVMTDTLSMTIESDDIVQGNTPTTTTVAPTTQPPTTTTEGATTTTLAPTTLAPTTFPPTTLPPGVTTTTVAPTTTAAPTTTVAPTTTIAPTAGPTTTTKAPTTTTTTIAPTAAPTDAPTTQEPTAAPTDAPTTQEPTAAPTDAPTTQEQTTEAPTTQTPTCTPIHTPFGCSGVDYLNHDGNCGFYVSCTDYLGCGGTNPICE